MTKFNVDVPLLARSFIGIDKLLNEAHFRSQQTTYPPYNVIKLDNDKYQIEFAVAGFSRQDLEIETMNGHLVVRGKKTQEQNSTAVNYVYQGLAKRSFTKEIALANNMKVTNAELADGMLTISLEREIPEALKPKLIAIN